MMRSLLVAVSAAALLTNLCMAAPAKTVKKDTTVKKAAAKPKFRIRVTTPVSELPVGSVAEFTISVKGENAANRKIGILTDGNPAVRKQYQITTDDKGMAKVSLSITRPGVVFCRAFIGNIRGDAAVMTDPGKVVPGLPEPADFKAYWNKVKAELDGRPMDAEVTPLPTEKNVKAFKIRFPMGGEGKDAYAKLTLPADAKPKSLPARMVFFGAGTDLVRPNYSMAGNHKMLVMTLNPMPVDNEERRGKYCRGSYRGYQHWGAADREKIFFNGMYRRLYRAMQYLKSRPEWDGRILIVSGSSQGGGQALAAAGLDPAVSCVVAHVPAICNHGNQDKGDAGWPAYYRSGAYRKNPKAVMYAASYIDAVNFARYINPKAECFVSTGLIDRVCPSESVFAAYNVIPCKNKTLVVTPRATHAVPRPVIARSEKFIRDHIKKMRKNK